MKLTKQTILKTITREHRLRAGDIDLHKVDGIWYWGGILGDLMPEACTHCVRLTDFDLDQWLADFEGSLSDAGADLRAAAQDAREALEAAQSNDAPKVLKLSRRAY